MTLTYTSIATHDRHGQRDRSRWAESKARDADRRSQRKGKALRASVWGA